jgi:uncharacterized membrane protein
MQFFSKIKPEYFFLFAASILGLCFIFVTPPALVPDEHDHFKRVYHISNGHFLPERNDHRLGGEMPVDFLDFLIPYRHAAFNPLYSLAGHKERPAFKKIYNDSLKQFDDFPSTSYYSPVSYLPQVLTVSILRRLPISVGTFFYTGRVFAFLIWLVSMFFLIRFLPVARWLFCALLLLPMHICVSASYSADIMTNMLSFWFIALVLKFTFDAGQMNAKKILALVFVGVLLSLSKMVYVPIALLVLAIPPSKYKNLSWYFLGTGAVLFFAFLAAWLWSNAIMQFYLPYKDYNPAFRDWCTLSKQGDYYSQLEFIKDNGIYYILKVIYHSLFNHPHTYLTAYIGTFGYLDIALPRWIVVFAYAFLFLLALTEHNIFKLNYFQKLLFVACAFLGLTGVIFSLHLNWDEPGEGVVDLLQGRYLTPLFPLVFVALSFLPLKKNPFPLLLPSLLAIGLFGCYLIDRRYFSPQYAQKMEFECGAEKLSEKDLFVTSHPKIFLAGKAGKNDSVALSGKSSVLLSKASPYGFTYKFKTLQKGDLIEMSAWQKGSGAQMVLSADLDSCGLFYLPCTPVAFIAGNGWSRMDYVITFSPACVPRDSIEAAFFIWNPNKTKTYIDDVKFSIKKFGNADSVIERR